jgi:hypothetical protein
VRSPQQIERYLDVPILAELPSRQTAPEAPTHVSG